MRILFVFIIAFVCIMQTNAQVINKSDDFLPPWRKGDMPKINNNKFYLKTFQGEGKTLREARENAILGLIADLASSKGVAITGKQEAEIRTKSLTGKYSEEENTKSTYTINSEGFNVAFEFLDEYWEEHNSYSGGAKFYCWGLFEVAYEKEVKTFDKLKYTTNYGFAATAKSIIIPGWGQLSKQHTLKGIAIFGSEALLVGSAILSENMRIDNITRMNNTRDVNFKKQYLYLANNWENVRNISFASAGAVYLYNIIDVIVSKGAKKYSNKTISLVPTYERNSMGVTLVHNF
ncbi:MAG: DUF5683 domain-containing protein [Paludibacter sp.]|nr:DUF5683 domain-containing protein [Paludibacter sp.]